GSHSHPGSPRRWGGIVQLAALPTPAVTPDTHTGRLGGSSAVDGASQDVALRLTPDRDCRRAHA
ncbi:MAG: hypothetical protein ACTHKL_13605, partial [Streptosporangiaceae bacterium]